MNTQAHITATAATRATTTRQGLGLFKMLVLMILMAGGILLAFTVYANWNEDANGDGQADGFTLRIFDSEWYRAAQNNARPMAQEAKAKLLAMRGKVTNKGGLLDQGEDVYQRLMHSNAAKKNKTTDATDNSQLAATEATATATAQAGAWDAASAAVHANDSEAADSYQFDVTASAQKPTLHLEDDILAAGEHFAAGKAAYLSAYNHNNELSDDYAVHMKHSQEELMRAKKILTPVLAEYTQRPDADPQMQHTSQRLLLAIDKLLADAYIH